jgi:hypothetical protein
MEQLERFRGLARDKRFWAVAGAAVVVAFLLGLWAVRAYHQSQSRELLNEFAAFEHPPLEIMFPRVVVSSDTSKRILEPGVRAGAWMLRERAGTSSSGPRALEVLLSDQGQKWFSVVGNVVIATFEAGTREVTRVSEIKETFPSRQVRFEYRWRELHPATAVLGVELPATGREYQGEAVFFYENNGWRLMHWSTPEFDQAVAQFKGLEATVR